jgi:hypothetical protein
MRTTLLALILALPAAGCGKDTSQPKPPPTVEPAPVGQPMTAIGSGAPGSATGSATPTPPTPPAPPPALPALAEDAGRKLGVPAWSTSVGGTQVDIGRAIAVAPDGAVYVVGDFEGTATFGAAGDRTAVGKSDAVLLRLGADGNVAAAYPFGGPNQERGAAVAVDAAGNVAYAGLFSDTAALGDVKATANGSDDLFVARLDAKGNVAWLWSAGGVGSDDVSALVAAPDGGWVLSVSFAEVITLGGVRLTSRGGTDVALVKLTADGDVAWVTQLGGDEDDLLNRLAIDSQGGLYGLGAFKGTTELGGGPLKSAGALDLMVARFDPAGRHLWSKRLGNPFNEKPGGIAVDRAGGIVITGSFDRDVDFLGTPVVSKGESDVFVARLTGDGALSWVKTYGADKEDAGFGIAVDSAGALVVTGWFEGSIDFGGGALKGRGYHDVFVARLGPDGSDRGAVRFGGQDYDEGRALALGADGAVYATGNYRYENDLGPTKPVAKQAPGTRFAKPDIFVVKLAP